MSSEKVASSERKAFHPFRNWHVRTLGRKAVLPTMQSEPTDHLSPENRRGLQKLAENVSKLEQATSDLKQTAAEAIRYLNTGVPDPSIQPELPLQLEKLGE